MDELTDQVIRSAFMTQYIYSKIAFDNAKDAMQLLEASKQNADMMVSATKYKLHRYVDEMLEMKLREIIDNKDGEVYITIGNGEFVLIKVKETK